MDNFELLLPMGSAFRKAMEIVRNDTLKKEKHSSLALAILSHVDKQPRISQSDIGRILHRDPMTVSQTVRILLNAGLVQHQIDAADRRVKRLTITRKGKLLTDALNDEEAKLITFLSKEWNRARINQFIKDIDDFNQFLGRVEQLPNKLQF